MGLIIFNWAGYRYIYDYLKSRAESGLQTRIDQNQYDESELTLIKVPITQLSYYNPNKEFEQVNGQVEFNGVVYQYVSKRIFNDSIEMLCMPNQKAMILSAGKTAYFKMVNDINACKTEAQQNHSKNHNIGSDLTDYILQESFHVNDLAFQPKSVYIFFVETLPVIHQISQEQPPDRT
jgi:hypothetical protein